jgi:hypothetical protein
MAEMTPLPVPTTVGTVVPTTKVKASPTMKSVAPSVSEKLMCGETNAVVAPVPPVIVSVPTVVPSGATTVKTPPWVAAVVQVAT